MPSIRQILVDWTTINGSGKVSVFYFAEEGNPSVQRASIGTFLSAADATLDSSVSWVVRTDGVEVDDATGTLTGNWGESTGQSGIGGGGGEPVADATQVVVRWKTPLIVNGRFLTGRTFLPGLASTNEVNGNLAPAAATTIQNAANTFTGGAGLFLIWHRPKKDGNGNIVAAGSSANVSAANVWGELGVLRKRRG